MATPTRALEYGTRCGVGAQLTRQGGDRHVDRTGGLILGSGYQNIECRVFAYIRPKDSSTCHPRLHYLSHLGAGTS